MNNWNVIMGVVVVVVTITILSTTIVVEQRCSSWNPYSPPYTYRILLFLIVCMTMLGIVLAIFPELMRKKLL